MNGWGFIKELILLDVLSDGGEIIWDIGGASEVFWVRSEWLHQVIKITGEEEGTGP